MRSISPTLAAPTPILAQANKARQQTSRVSRSIPSIVELAAQQAAEAAAVEDHRAADHRPGERTAPASSTPQNQPRAAALDREIRHRIALPPRCATRGAGGKAPADRNKS